jgi:regulation of enolase protein 1 (concanavalin A-like superfamily)
MSTSDLAFGRKVVWRGLRAEIVDIRVSRRGAAVRIRVIGGYQHWTTPAELQEVEP